MARAIRPTILLALATGAIVLALLLTGVLGGAGPSPAGAATKGATERAGESAEPAGESESATEPAGESESATEPAGESATEPAGESESESATEPAGESQPGHQDAQGEQVDHQCPPACTAGEQP